MKVMRLIALKPRRIARQQGFTLIEVLIAFAVLSVGLLGIVSLLGMSKMSQHLAIQHTRAVTLAETIVERMRSNPAGLASYNLGIDTPIGGTTRGAQPVPDCRAANCTPDELALQDLWVWEQAMNGAMASAAGANTSGLSAPQGCIVFTPSPGYARTGLLSVVMQWRGLQKSYDAVQPGEATCGGLAAGTDLYRRQVVTSTYVIDETEL